MSKTTVGGVILAVSTLGVSVGKYLTTGEVPGVAEVTYIIGLFSAAAALIKARDPLPK